MNEKTPSLSRQDWIDAALIVLAESGIEAVGIEPLAARLQVTKGSFYWHFKNRPALLDALRGAWEQRSTRVYIEQISALQGSPQDRLEALFVMTAAAPRPVDRAIRAWALKDAATAERVRVIDEDRTAFTAKLLHECGHSRADADAYARLIACFVVGESMRGLKAVESHRRLYARLLGRAG